MTLASVERSLGRIEAKLDLALAANENQERRITALEHTKTRIAAFASVAGVVGSAGWALAAQILGKDQ